MLKKERHEIILDVLGKEKKVLSNELSIRLEVSEDTIRRDLKELANEGKLLKVHGGALNTSQNLYSFREEEIYDLDKKRIMAKKALALIDNYDVLILGGGTTNLELASLMPHDLGVTVFTYSLPVAMRLSIHPKAEVVLLGGKLQKQAQVTIGSEIIQYVSSIRADHCFLGASGLDLETGLMEIDWEISKIKQAVLEVSDRVTVMSTSEKLNTKERFLVCEPGRIHTLITELDPSDPLLKGYREQGIEVL